ncbi:MAG: hypothetical protein EXR27_14760 [Betaproteobacteria bacterium]|nr:hypothetical protein [Betaproteobacteria bacterium]
MKFPHDAALPPPYLQARQAQRSPPNHYENLLGDAIEAAFGAGIWDLPGVVARLNQEGVRTPNGDTWTDERFEAVMAQLGA